MYHHRETIKSNQTLYDDTKKKAHDSQRVRAKATVKLNRGGPATDKHQAPTYRLKLYLRAVV